MPVYIVSCPECRKSLRSTKPVKPGKIVTCPKCEVMFAAPASRLESEVVDNVEVIDDAVEVVDEVEVVDDDRRRGKKKSKAVKVVEIDDEDDDSPKRVLKRKKSGGGNVALVAGLIGGGVLLLVGGAGLAWWLLAGGGGDEPLAYVPSNSAMVIGGDGKAILDSKLGPTIERVLDAAVLPGYVRYKRDTGTSGQDLLSQFVVGIQSGPAQSMTLVMKSAVPLDGPKLASAVGGAAASIGGYKGFKMSGAGGSQSLVIPAKRVAVFSNLGEAEFGTVLKAGGKVPAVSGDILPLIERGKKHHLWMAMDKSALSAGNSQAAGMLGGLAGGAQSAELLAQMKGAVVGINFSGDDIEMNIAAALADAAAAAKMTELAQAEAAKSKGSFAQQALLFALPAAIKALVQEMTEIAQYTTDGNLSITTMRVKATTIENAIGAAALLMPAAPPAGRPGRGGAGAGAID